MKRWFCSNPHHRFNDGTGRLLDGPGPGDRLNLTPQQKFLSCFAKPGYTPTAQVIVQRGTDNDVLILRAQHLKPNLGFDLFTIQNSNLLGRRPN